MNPAVQITGLNKWFGGFHALKDVSLSVDQDECVVICGPLGSGKSSLIRCINGLESFTAGSIAIGHDRLPATGAQLAQIRQRMGMVFHDINLFPHLSVLQNCAWAPGRARGMTQAEAEAEARHALDHVGMADHMDSRPAALTPGQQQRVAIARALAMDPDILLFDEPTGGLDPAMAGEVTQVMTSLAGALTMICVTNDMRFARAAADRVVFMDRGRVVEIAPPDRFIEAPSSRRAAAFLDPPA